MSETKIKLVQKPVIQHALAEIGADVTKRLEEANVDNLVATDETIQSLKTLRSSLNKELAGYESQRKEIKSAVSDPYIEFNNVYTKEVSEKFKAAIDTLKSKIGEFENKVKEDKKGKVQSYFAELCLDADIDFVKFDDVKLKIDLSTSLKKYKERCQEFVTKVTDDIQLIKTTEFEAEIMTAYKETLNASKAITDVRTRKERERLEADRIQQERTDKRIGRLHAMAMVRNDITNSYCWVRDNDIFIEVANIENLSDAGFDKEYVRVEAAIKAKSVSEKKEEPKEDSKPETKTAAPLKTPSVVAPKAEEKTVVAKFECRGTRSKLIALGQYMKENGINYQNIK